MRVERYFLFLVVCLIKGEKGLSFTSTIKRALSNTSNHGKATFHSGRRTRQLYMGDDGSFWDQQKELMEEMTGRAEKSLRKEQLEKYTERRNGLISDTAFFTSLIFSFLWGICDNPFISFSYVFGAIFGLAYAYGLGRYVESIGGSVDDTEAVQGAGVGQARFAFLILLFIFVGKFRSVGLEPIPAILGFFTYQIASLSQGLKEIND